MQEDDPSAAGQIDDESPATPEPPSLFREFRETRRLIVRTWGPLTLLTVVGFFIAWMFVEPAPPTKIKIAAGPRGGGYFRFATEYAEIFAANGYELEVIETAGSVENYERLKSDDDIHIAIVQGGARPEEMSADDLEAIASLYFEPLWIFTRSETRPTQLSELAGRSIAIGAPQSGTRAVLEMLLRANRLLPPADADPDENRSTSEMVRPTTDSGQQAADRLRAGEIDAAGFVLPAEHPLIRELLETPGLALLQWQRREAYQQLYPFLSAVTLYEGVLDLAENVPDQDEQILAPVANLICTPELHDTFVPLFIKAAKASHEQGTLLVPQGKFPSLEYAEYPAHPAALDYFEYGPSFLNRYLPFWLASFLNRMKILLLPLLTLAIPLVKMAPPIYRWQIRARIYRWYDLLREVDQQQGARTPQQLRHDLARLHTMETELQEINVPLSFMEEFYHLHLHVDLVKRRLLKSLEPESADAPRR